MRNLIILRFISFLLFGIFLIIGVNLAKLKPLWNDEIYTQTSSVENLSYKKIIFGKIKEGNNSPFFYLIQKSICDIFRYSLPYEWKGGEIDDQKAQILLRMSSNVFMALSVTIFFYFFSRYYSLGFGIYALLVALSSFMVWYYWVEARPYSLWVFLTTVQSLVFLRILKNSSYCLLSWHSLAVINILMAVTSFLSIIQIFIVSLVLWVFKEKRWKAYLWMTVFPLCLLFFYYFHAPKYKFWIADDGIMPLIYSSISEMRLVLIITCIVLGGIFYFKKSKVDSIFLGVDVRGYAAFFGFVLVGTFGVLLWLMWKDSGGLEGFSVTTRYFIYLTPVGIIANVLCLEQLVKIFKNNFWMVTNIIIIFSGIAGIEFVKNSIWFLWAV
ncbi:hypothetical protein MNBD_UNCLBAC01-267 [hydrothermal vent metagenome]|uniref:Glycosyltransferase RgtA/B/C/D-like domain-containing protein n=1 Tax=hydrothermal vent metagenome TaxID=652676 RepID=A0A3B1DJ58_9ZZZZ